MVTQYWRPEFVKSSPRWCAEEVMFTRGYLQMVDRVKSAGGFHNLGKRVGTLMERVRTSDVLMSQCVMPVPSV